MGEVPVRAEWVDRKSYRYPPTPGPSGLSPPIQGGERGVIYGVACGCGVPKTAGWGIVSGASFWTLSPRMALPYM